MDPKTENTGGRLFETTQMIKSLGKKAKQGMNIEHDEGGGLNFLGKRDFVNIISRNIEQAEKSFKKSVFPRVTNEGKS